MTPARAGVIYRRDFWIEGLPLPIGYALFDSGVNIGKVTAILKLQRAMGVKADGVVGVGQPERYKQTRSKRTKATINRFH